MGKRIVIKINYQYNEDWIGGSYYIQNLIHALNTLEDSKKPSLLIHSSNENAINELKSITNYPYLKRYSFNNLNILQRGINYFSRKILKINIFRLFPDFLFAFPSSYHEREQLEKQIFWIPDFQDKYLPHFFSEEELKSRDSAYTFIQNNAQHVLFSSEDAQNDFNTFYKDATPKQYVLNFASFHQDENLPSTIDVLEKFSITGEYFLCSNQFWIHKNHTIVLKAIALLKKEGRNICVVFTGKENDYRNPDYYSNLRKKVVELDIENNVKFLGFIDRKDQIVLLKNCKAIIQPSLFEGWSTVNEDAKAENIFILAANLNVNKEQLINYPNYKLFNPNDEKTLAQEIMNDNFTIKEIDYKQNIKKFGLDFLKIIEHFDKP
ncbi:hypothetical protein GCM10010992_10020 [Cloacibacterium rupense]|uniref:Glycosyl transferase family 1 domain-containing protein n=1 Tax=Cloacibacterium rupense TaxID=517423 RepID=A0ABQ2NIT7_9FLAO|nr:glycosyltransferase [Cloacibacterium rupense]GGP03074.1 hypothetical protein GCM10010992_10020 [Cloacibacterium rupense]